MNLWLLARQDPLVLFDFGMKPDAFRAARRAVGLTQAELAAKLGLSDGRSIRRYEAGERPIPIPTAALMMVWAAAMPKPKKKGKRK